MNAATFRILTPEESAANDRLLAFRCLCTDPVHVGLFDGRTTCERAIDNPSLCPDCERYCMAVVR